MIDALFSRPIALPLLMILSSMISFSTIAGLVGWLSVGVTLATVVNGFVAMTVFFVAGVIYENRQTTSIGEVVRAN